MRARESYFSTGLSHYEPQGRGWRRLVVVVLGTLALWLLSGCESKEEMPNSVKGMIMGLMFFLSVAGIVLAVRKVRENDQFVESLRDDQMRQRETKRKHRREFWEQCQWPHDVPVWTVGPLECLSEPASVPLVDPFAECTDGLDGDEMHRILVSVAAEAQEVRHLQTVARTTLNLDDADDVLVLAGSKMDALIRCVEALCGRLCPVIAGDEEPPTRRLGDVEMGRRKDSKPTGKPSYAELAAVVTEAAVYMRGDSSFDESGRVARIICEAAAKLEGGSEV